MSEFVPDPVRPVYISVGMTLVDMLGGEYKVEAVTDDHFDVRSTKPVFKVPSWMGRPGVIRYRWDEPMPLRPRANI